MSQRHRIGRARYVVPRARPRWAVATAVGAAVAIVLATVLMIWLLRPGADPSSGGLANRQPRATWLVAGALVAAVVGLVAVVRARRGLLARRAIALPGVIVVVAVGAVVVGALWPGGLLRHPPAAPEMPDLGDMPAELPFETVPAPADGTAPPDDTAPPDGDDPAPSTTPGASDAPPTSPPTAPPTTGSP